jgi:hypothetical protein
MKKTLLMILGTAALIVSGCATAPVAVAPVGPNPGSLQAANSNGPGDGQLEVFSRLSGHREGTNPTWGRHSDYYIYDSQGNRLQHVDNNVGYYSSEPRIVSLPSGHYVVEARAKGTLSIKVPVVIILGETTQVHLDGNWQPGTAQAEVVTAPAGYAIGWRADDRSGGN